MREQTDRQTGRSNLRLTRKSAFTLVELLVVIVVIGILFAVLISRVDFAGDRAKRTGAMTDLHAYQTAIVAAAQEYGVDHDVEDFVKAVNISLDSELKLSVEGENMVSGIADPWGTPYKIITHNMSCFVGYSAGPDMKFKTADDSAVVVSGVRFDNAITHSFPQLEMYYVESLESCSWEKVAELSEMGLAPVLFELGETKTLFSGGTYQARIVGFDHDDLSDGSGKAGISFVMATDYSTKQMSSAGTNTGGWKNSDVRSALTTRLVAPDRFPTELRAVVKRVNKLSDGGCGSTQLVTTQDILWIPSYTEVGFPEDSKALAGQGTAYPWFTDDASRVCYEPDDAVIYWLRSSRIHAQSGYWAVARDGSVSYDGAATTRFLFMGFCI